MKSTTKIILGIITVATAGALWLILQPTNTPTPEVIAYETQQNEGGEVTVTVTPVTLKSGLPPSFDIVFETHSVDLAFDVEQVATLADGTGTAYAPYWEGSPPGGHHRSGTLRFTPDLLKTGTFILTFNNIAGIATRTFTWEVK